MVHSNERGRALEYRIAVELIKTFQDMNLETKSSENTIKLNFRDKKYFEELDEHSQKDFDKCAIAIGKWLKEQVWFENAELVTIDRFGDDKAKKRDPTDIQIGISKKDGSLLLKNFSLKHHHDALCHPRLPSTAQQCGFEKDSKEDIEYRKKYSKIWESFGKKVKSINPKIKEYKDLDTEIKFKYLYTPLMKHTAKFLNDCSNRKKHVESLFDYLVGTTDYVVLKNEPKEVIIKYFEKSKLPTKFKIIYPYKENTNDPRSYMLLEFNNSWKIRIRIHNASGRIFKNNGEIFATEKMDPICINLNKLIKSEILKK